MRGTGGVREMGGKRGQRVAMDGSVTRNSGQINLYSCRHTMFTYGLGGNGVGHRWRVMYGQLARNRQRANI